MIWGVTAMHGLAPLEAQASCLALSAMYGAELRIMWGVTAMHGLAPLGTQARHRTRRLEDSETRRRGGGLALLARRVRARDVG